MRFQLVRVAPCVPHKGFLRSVQRNELPSVELINQRELKNRTNPRFHRRKVENLGLVSERFGV